MCVWSAVQQLPIWTRTLGVCVYVHAAVAHAVKLGRRCLLTLDTLKSQNQKKPCADKNYLSISLWEVALEEVYSQLIYWQLGGNDTKTDKIEA